MTNEEAIRIAQGLIVDFKCESETMVKFCNTVIAALKVEPCEDTISRKHLLSEIDALMQSPWFNNGKDGDRFTHYGYVERKEAVEVVRDLCVKALQPVTPKQRRGKWILDDETDSITCDKCGCLLWANDIYIGEANYCPNCDTKMEEE